MAVHVSSAVEGQLLELGRGAGDDAGVVHHLGEPEHPPPPHEGLEISGGERSPRRLEGRRGHARRGREEDVELQARRGVEQPVDAVDAEDVRDLVRVGHDCRRPEREDEPRELVDHELHRLQVHVRVDEARDDVLARRVERFDARVVTEPGDEAVDDRDIRLEPLLREDGEHLASSHDEVGGLVPSGDGEAAAAVLPCAERNTAGTGARERRNARPGPRRALSYSRAVIACGRLEEKMRRKFVVTGLVLAFAVVGLVLTTTGSAKPEQEPFKVAWIYPGPHKDGGWSQAHDKGRLPSRRRSAPRCRRRTRRTSSRTRRFRRSSRVSFARATR